MTLKSLTAAVVMCAVSFVPVAHADVDTSTTNWWLHNGCNSTDNPLCIGYVAALVDRNGVDIARSAPMWCPAAGVTVEQAEAIIVQTLRNAPQSWHDPFLVMAIGALAVTFPCQPANTTGNAR
jgi:hypothetical protein